MTLPKKITTEKIPIYLWLDDIEEGALQQAKNLANLDFAYHHIAIMPDAHQGYGMPIGGVMATQDVVIPHAVGVDIGCGMCAVKTSFKNLKEITLKRILKHIRDNIPVGFKKHQKPQNTKHMPPLPKNQKLPIVESQFKYAHKQVGTLGGGNHFIEIQKGDDDHIWIMIHSGSRNLGYKVAHHYDQVAQELNEEMGDMTAAEKQLAYLPLDSSEGQTYLNEMQYCVDFALANRKLMMTRVKEAFKDTLGIANFSDMINIAHNYANLEEHYGQEVMVHRKGATQAQKGQLGIIPGSQGSASYIVSGKGNPDSYKSCSHGAGRVMSRTKARKILSLKKEKEKLDEKGILHSIRHKKDLDEASSAYKKIDQVMKNQENLVKIKVKLQPLAVVKG